MFCTSCGKSIDENSMFCPGCGTDLRNLSSAVPPVMTAPIPTAPVASNTTAAPSAVSEKPSLAKSADSTGSQIGVFLREYMKSPVLAVSRRASEKYVLWGLVPIGAYLFAAFLVSLIGNGSLRSFGYDFGYLIGNVVRFATLIFGYYLFQSIFHVKKKNLASIVAVIGLAFLPILPIYIVESAFSALFRNYSIFSGLMTGAYIIAGIILYDELSESSDDNKGMGSFLTVLLSFACMPVFGGIVDLIVNKLFYYIY